MMRYAFLFALMGLSCSCNLAQSEGETYKDVCRDSDKVKLTTMAQVQQLFEQISSHPGEIDCPSNVRESIRELLELIKTDELHICSQRKSDMFRNFYDKFVTSKDTRAPGAIRSFYAAYGLRVSQICRRRMVQLLDESRLGGLLSAEDRETLDQWSSDESPLTYILKSPKDFDDLQVPKPLTRDFSLPMEQEYLYLRAETVSKIRRQQAQCERRFKPIYEPLVGPVVSLSNLGFNYRGSDAIAVRPADVHEYIYQWYRALFMCRLMSTFVLVDDEKVAPTANGNEQRVRLLPVAKTQEYDGSKTYEEMIKSFEDIKPLDVPPREDVVRVMDPIVKLNDGSLVSAMKKFKRKSSKVRKGASFSRRLLQRIESGLSRYATEKMSAKAGTRMIALIDKFMHKKNIKDPHALADQSDPTVPIVLALLAAFVIIIVIGIALDLG